MSKAVPSARPTESLETSTGLRPKPPLSSFSSKRTPLPGPPPTEEPPPHALLPEATALTAVPYRSEKPVVPWAPGDLDVN